MNDNNQREHKTQNSTACHYYSYWPPLSAGKQPRETLGNRTQTIEHKRYTPIKPTSTLPTMQTINLLLNKSCLIVSALVASIFILLLAETTYSNHVQQEASGYSSLEHRGYISPSAASKLKSRSNAMEVHHVHMSLPFGSGKEKKTLSYYECGENISSPSSKHYDDYEIILLHGAAYTKENWKESNIMENLCLKGNKKKRSRMHVIALDLSVKSDGHGFESAFNALVQNGDLSGNPAVIVTPSASGNSIVSMVAEDQGIESKLKKYIKAWVPIASFAVLPVNNDSMQIFHELDIPILAIHGDEDIRGKEVTAKLVNEAKAIGVEIDGGHSCYLDSPTLFETTVLTFLHDYV